MAIIMTAFASTKVICVMALPLIGMVGQQGIQLLSLLREMQLPKLHMLQRLPQQIRKLWQMAPRADVAVAHRKLCPLHHLLHRRRRRLLITRSVDVDTLIQRRAEWHLVGAQVDVMVTEFRQTQLVGQLNQIPHLALGSGVRLVLQQKVGPLEVTPARKELVSLCKSTS